MSSPGRLHLARRTRDQESPPAIRRDPEFISIPEWSRRVGCAPDSGYRAARRNEIPGMFRIGRLMRVNWQAFVEATAHIFGDDASRQR
jgi:predicted DNA-binding transcriptional regulator AlpA